MTAAWITIGCLALATALVKAAGPVVLGGRPLPDAALGVIALLAPALLGALVVTQTFGGEGSELTVDARVAGVAAAGVALALRWSIVPTIVLAGAAAAIVRLLGG